MGFNFGPRGKGRPQKRFCQCYHIVPHMHSPGDCENKGIRKYNTSWFNWDGPKEKWFCNSCWKILKKEEKEILDKA